jgi:hypothetical protein
MENIGNTARKLLFTVARKEFRLDFFRAGGKGGQKQNTCSSACRITHPESGAVGECREERHQHTNRKRALERLVETAKFKAWVRVKAAAIFQGFRDVEEKVDRMLRPKNLKVEVLNSYTCDGCGRKSSRLPAPRLPGGWTYEPLDTHYCSLCTLKRFR